MTTTTTTARTSGHFVRAPADTSKRTAGHCCVVSAMSSGRSFAASFSVTAAPGRGAPLAGACVRMTCTVRPWLLEWLLHFSNSTGRLT